METELSSIIQNAISWIAPIFVLIVAIMAITMIWKRNWMGAITMLGMGAIACVFLFVGPSMFAAISGEPEAGSTRSPEPTKAPEPASSAPAVDAPPVDLTVLWIGLGVAAGVLVIGILVVVLFSVAKRARHASLELREKQEAAAAEKAKALAVWSKSTDRHAELKDKVIEIETDWDLLFSYPALVDASVPQTAAFHRALKAADAASSEPPADLSLSMDIGALPYPRLVAQADEAWDRAWSFAKLTGLKLIPRAERKKVDQIVKLLKLARDGGGSEHERSVAYERASKLIGELHFVRVPEAALKAITVETRQMIEAAPRVAERAPELLFSERKAY